MSPQRCSYFRCKNRSNMKSMFHFPINDVKRLKAWLNNCGNMVLTQFSHERLHNKYICIDHFDPNYIIRYNWHCRKNSLVKTAVPKPYYELANFSGSSTPLKMLDSSKKNNSEDATQSNIDKNLDANKCFKETLKDLDNNDYLKPTYSVSKNQITKVYINKKRLSKMSEEVLQCSKEAAIDKVADDLKGTIEDKNKEVLHYNVTDTIDKVKAEPIDLECATYKVKEELQCSTEAATLNVKEESQCNKEDAGNVVKEELQCSIEDARANVKEELQWSLEDARANVKEELQCSIEDVRVNVNEELQCSIEDARANVKEELQCSIEDVRVNVNEELQCSIEDARANVNNELQCNIEDVRANVKEELQCSIEDITYNIKVDA